MTYKKIDLIVENFVLRNTVNIFRSIKNSVDANEINYPNYGQHTSDMSIRVRIDLLTAQAEQAALTEVNRLIGTNTILRSGTNQWIPKNQVATEVKAACTLSSECACILSDLPYFSNISAQNRVPQLFFPCLLARLFQEIGIDLHFRPQELQDVIEREHYEDTITTSIDAITGGVGLNRADFSNRLFFKRFVHMLCNNIIDVNRDGEDLFWGIFRRRNRRTADETCEQILQRFCNEL